MVGAGESPLTEVALEGSVACVFPVVAGQLVGAGEFPAASLPGTVVWLFTSVSPHVRLQVRALGVGFSASRKLTIVRGGPSPSPRAPSPFRSGFFSAVELE